MSPDKTLAEALLRVRNAMRDLAPYEKAAVLAMAGNLVQTEIQSAQMEANAAIMRALSPTPTPVNDEHYRA